MKSICKRKHISILLAVLLLFSGCKKSEPITKQVTPEATSIPTVTTQAEPTVTPTPTLTPTVTQIPEAIDAGILIDRPTHEPVSDPSIQDTWTILVYLCGTDLESNGGYASLNIEELFPIEYSDKVKVVIETGGARSWKMQSIKSDRLERFVVENGGLTKVGEAKQASMGDGETFYQFLSWGVRAYPADRTGVILWDHGSGSIGGVVFDELYDYDSLSLLEMDSALKKVYAEMDHDFEFIGFDACLMSTIETANIMASYAKYMIASQEYESGTGWDYTAMAKYINENPTANGSEVGQVICDSFAEKCNRDYEDTTYTLSVVNLEKIDKLLYAFDKVAQRMSENTNNAAIVSELAKGAYYTDRFGANSAYEGYSNMIDLGRYIENVRQTVGGTVASAINFALNDAIEYVVNGADHSDATGLSVFYPLAPEKEGLSTISGICVSPYYLIYIDAIIYGSTGHTLDDYSNDYWDDNYGGYWSETNSDDDDWYTSWDDHWDEYYDSSETETDTSSEGVQFYDDDTSSIINFAEKPHLSEDGYFTFTMDAQTMNYVQAIDCSIFADIGEGSRIDLGVDNDVYVDWETGVVQDAFTGIWPALPDNQTIQMTLIYECDEYNLYSVPILLNGTETNLRVKWVWSNPGVDNVGSYVVVGAWQGIDSDTGMTSRDLIPIVAGDVITPVYDCYNSYFDNHMTRYGDDYKVTDDFYIDGIQLAAGDYYYGFVLTDIFGQTLHTNYITYNLDEAGELYYYN